MGEFILSVWEFWIIGIFSLIIVLVCYITFLSYLDSEVMFFGFYIGLVIFLAYIALLLFANLDTDLMDMGSVSSNTSMFCGSDSSVE